MDVKVESYYAKWVSNKAFPDLTALFILAAGGLNMMIAICSTKDLPEGFLGAIGCGGKPAMCY